MCSFFTVTLSPSVFGWETQRRRCCSLKRSILWSKQHHRWTQSLPPLIPAFLQSVASFLERSCFSTLALLRRHCWQLNVGNWMIRVSKTKKNTKHLQCILMSSGKLSENQQPRRGFVWQNKHCVFLIIFIFQVTENTASLLEIDMVIMTSPMGWL